MIISKSFHVASVRSLSFPLTEMLHGSPDRCPFSLHLVCGPNIIWFQGSLCSPPGGHWHCGLEGRPSCFAILEGEILVGSAGQLEHPEPLCPWSNQAGCRVGEYLSACTREVLASSWWSCCLPDAGHEWAQQVQLWPAWLSLGVPLPKAQLILVAHLSKSISSMEVQKPLTPPFSSLPIPWGMGREALLSAFINFLLDSFLPALISSLISFTFPPLHPTTTACTSAADLCICAAGGPDLCTSFPLLNSHLMINLPLPQSLLDCAQLATQAYSSCSQQASLLQ